MKATELLAAIRQDHPELHQVPDQELLNAGIQDLGIHPTQVEYDLPGQMHWTGEQGITSLAPEDIAARGGAQAAQFLRQSGQETQQEVPGMLGQTLGGLAKGAAAITPQTPGEVELQAALPYVTKGLGAGFRAIAATEPGSAAMTTLSKVPQHIIQEVAKAPEILDRYLPVEKAGQVLNDFFGQFGLKSGSSALATTAEEKGLGAAPTLGSFKGTADNVVNTLKAREVEKQAVEQGIQDLSPKMQQAGQNLMDAEAKYGPLSPEANEAHVKLHDIKGKAQTLMLRQDALNMGINPAHTPNLQDVMTARQYLSKITAKQALQTAENQVVTPIAEANKDIVDNYLDEQLQKIASKNPNIQPMNIPGYGTVDKADQVRQIYHEAKIGERFGSYFPQNRNMSPDALRTILGLMKSPIMPILQSPKVQGMALGLSGTPGALAGTAATGIQNLMGSQSNENQ